MENSIRTFNGEKANLAKVGSTTKSVPSILNQLSSIKFPEENKMNFVYRYAAEYSQLKRKQEAND